MGAFHHLSKMRFYIETYGCTANHGNSEEFSRALMDMGHGPSSLEEADLVIVNTCVVTERTERNMIKRICQLQGDKLVIAGCLPKAIPEVLRRIRCRERLGILNREAALQIGEAFDATQKTKESNRSPIKKSIRAEVARHLCSVVNISEGCKGNCSYCITKKARGHLKSRPPEEVAKEVRLRLEEGAVEVQLGSQDASAYGMDMGSSLPELLNMINEIPGYYKLRVGMMNPSTLEPVLDDLVKSYKNPNIYKFVHLPVQSGSDSVLERMNRFYKAEDFARITARLRRGIPDLTLHTDVIVGFPNETEDDFRATKDLMRTIQPDKINVTRFSSRPHTEASRFKELPSAIKKARSRDFTRLWQEIAASRNEHYVGKVVSVLVTEEGKDETVKARTQNYREVVIDEKLPLGSSWDVKVAKANSFYLRATSQNGEQSSYWDV